MSMKLSLLSAALVLAAITGASAEPIELKFAVSTPPQVHYNQKVLIPWAEKVSADSQGTLKVKMYFAGALGKAGQFVDIVESGAADIAMDIVSYYPGRFPLADVTYLPSLVGFDAVKASDALWSMYEENAFGHDFDGLKLLAISTPTAAMLMTTEKPVRTPDDAKGMKIAGGGKIKADIVESIGAAMIDMEVFDMYQSLGRGVVNGAITHYTGVAPFKLNEVGKYFTSVALGGSFTPVFMSQEKFDSLPDAAKKAIEMNSGASLTAAIAEVWRDADAQGRAMVEKSGGTIITLDADTQAAWDKALEPVTQAWIQQGEGRQDIIDTLKEKLSE